MVGFRQSVKELAVDEWNLSELAGLSVEAFWNWDKTDTTGYGGHTYLARNKCVDFDRELWLKLEKCMWRNHWSVYQDHMKYIHNDVLKPFRVKILR